MGPGQPREGAWKPYDVNGDGKVTRAEFLAVRELCFVRYDGNGDGILTPAEIRRRLPGRPAEGLGAAVARMDRDRDGEISREEYEWESSRLFQLLDTNGDGVIAGMELSAFGAVSHSDLCQSSGPPQSYDSTGVPGAPRKPGIRGDR
jgi:Ca2+-binding EF-hand superfamily protein